MKIKGVIVEIEDKGYVVELETGDIGILPIYDIHSYKLADTFINKTVEVIPIKAKDNYYILDSRFRLCS